MASDTVLLGNNFPTFRKIALIYFSNGILDPQDSTENSESVRQIMKCLLIKPRIFKYVFTEIG